MGDKMSTKFTKFISIFILLLVSLQVVTAINFSSPSALGMSLATSIISSSAVSQLQFCGYETEVGDADCDGVVEREDAELIAKLEKSCRTNGGEDPSGNAINSGLEVDRIIFVDGEYIQRGQRLGIAMDLENNGPKDLQNVRFRLTIPELGISKSGRYFDLDRRDDEIDTIYVEIPEDAQPGDYLVRLEVSNTKNDIRRIKHRYVTVTE